MDTLIQGYATGWLREFPDVRDYSLESPRVQTMLQRSVALRAPGESGMPATVDLRQWCPPVEDQGQLGSCTAHAGVGLVEYSQRRATGAHLDASRLFLYKATRNLLRWQGDTGAFLRTTLKALVLFGVPPEEYYPYNAATFDAEPPAFAYAFAQSYQTINYLRLDPPGTNPRELLRKIKTMLLAGYPAAFGFTVYASIGQAARTGEIPFPSSVDRASGGHAVMAVGYDDNKVISGRRGALLIRNSWGTGWGQAGYGWLPYDYVLNGLSVDWWCVLKQEWVDTGNFD
jgi:C1A family cysteine protease